MYFRRMKKTIFDTAYTYSSAEFDKNGHCILLNGFAFKSLESGKSSKQALNDFAVGVGVCRGCTFCGVSAYGYRYLVAFGLCAGMGDDVDAGSRACRERA